MTLIRVEQGPHMSYSLSSVKGLYRGFYRRPLFGLLRKGILGV